MTMTSRPLLLGVLVGLVAVAVALALPWRRGAVPGALGSSLTGVASLAFMRRSARAPKPVQASLAVMALMFLVRIVVVAGATVAVVRAGASVAAFLVAFFLPYFLYTAVEGSYLASLSRVPGRPS